MVEQAIVNLVLFNECPKVPICLDVLVHIVRVLSKFGNLQIIPAADLSLKIFSEF